MQLTPEKKLNKSIIKKGQSLMIFKNKDGKEIKETNPNHFSMLEREGFKPVKETKPNLEKTK
jgi:hypothetical protein